MANELLRKLKVEYSFQSSVYVPTGNNDLSDGSPTTVDLTLDEGGTGLANAEAVNSDQLDLGAIWPGEFYVGACIEWFTAVTAGNLVDFYWSPSANSNVGVGNPGSPDGIDGKYDPTANFTVLEGVAQMMFIGSHVNNGHQSTQIAPVGIFSPPTRYGQLIVLNNSGVLMCGTDDIESAVLMYGFIDEIQ